MYEIRVHGRGGQGVVTATNILALAALHGGYHVRSFPLYGPERRGAPVMGFLQMDRRPVRLHCAVYRPDCVMVIDTKLSESNMVLGGLKPNGILILNTAKDIDELEISVPMSRLVTLNATKIARDMLRKAITNTTMLGAFVRGYPEVSMDHMIAAIEHKMKGNAAENIDATRAAFEQAQVRDFPGEEV